VTKYGQTFLVGLQSNLVYRWNFAVRSLFWFCHLVVVFILWGAAYAGNPKIGGYTFAQTLTYFVVIFVMQFFVGAFNEDYQISEDIRNGLINQFLLKPINYFAYRLSVFSVPAMLLTGIIQFSIAYCFGLLAFWFLEIQGFVILSMAVETLLGGQIVPLDLLPPSVFNVVRFLPFFYQAYFPTAILTGRQGYDFAVQGLAIQAAWAVVLVCLAEAVWRRGLRHHTAAGG
jgi:ABC-2 type transport system permease protein